MAGQTVKGTDDAIFVGAILVAATAAAPAFRGAA
jgi:hypothetical protein